MTRVVSLGLVLALGLAACIIGEGSGKPGGGGGGPDAGGGGGGPDAGGGGGGGPDAAVPTEQSVLAQFGACMTLEDWEAAGLGGLSQIGACVACHSAGEGGVYLAADSTETFTKSQTFPYVAIFADTDGQLVPIPTDAVIAAGVAGSGHTGATYTVPDALQQGLTQFFTATKAKYDLGGCPAPTLP